LKKRRRAASVVKVQQHTHTIAVLVAACPIVEFIAVAVTPEGSIGSMN
jgi:hypothetical protein